MNYDKDEFLENVSNKLLPLFVKLTEYWYMMFLKNYRIVYWTLNIYSNEFYKN